MIMPKYGEILTSVTRFFGRDRTQGFSAVKCLCGACKDGLHIQPSPTSDIFTIFLLLFEKTNINKNRTYRKESTNVRYLSTLSMG